VEAAVVKVDGAHHAPAVVADQHLGVDKTGGILADFYPSLQQGAVVGLGQGEHGLLVGDVGQDQDHLHTAPCGVGEGGEHLAVDDQVGGHDVDVVAGAADDVHVHHLRQFVVVE